MLSKEFLLERGHCCGHGCLMCPYHPKHTEGNTKVMRVGIVTGVFDLLHPGHIKLLQWCRERCEFLIVMLQKFTDERPNKGFSIQTWEEELQLLNSLGR